nr:hypothetical protein [Periweissella beninensis]
MTLSHVINHPNQVAS